jgi:hypothetical protein
LADTAREKLASHLASSVECLTIAKFRQEQIQELEIDFTENDYSQKSKLMLFLATIYARVSDEKNYIFFEKCFNYFTEFRSFTLDDEILNSILEKIEPEIQKSVLYFHHVFNSMNLVDEHGTYFLWSDKLRSGNLPIKYPQGRSLIFWGFDFMSASQVDLIKSLAIRDDVYIPFSQDVFVRSNELDWIKWLAPSPDLVELLPAMEQDFSPIKYLEFELGNMAKTMKSHFGNSQPNMNIYLLERELGLEDISEIPFSLVHYKTKVDIFEIALNEIFQEILTINHTFSFEVLCKQLTGMKSAAVDTQNFRKLKVIQSFFENLNYWNGLSEENIVLGEFELKTIYEATKLNLPRIYGINQNIANINILSKKDILNEVPNGINVVCAKQAYGPLKNSDSLLNKEVEQILATIGPVKRAELEYLLFKQKLKEVLCTENSILFIENKLADHDLGWSEIFKDFSFSEIQTNLNVETNSGYQFNLPRSIVRMEKISYSRLQSYIDCPRKYYHQYVEKLAKNIIVNNTFSPSQLGTLEHKVIEKHFKQFSSFNEKNYHEFLITCVDEFLKSESLNVDLALYQGIIAEITDYTRAIIENLYTLQSHFNLSYTFEKKIQDSGDKRYTGSIDFFAQGPVQFLIDFKRSAASIPSNAEILDLRKIQLWHYLLRMQGSDEFNSEKPFVIGYVNLSELSKSLLYTNISNEADLSLIAELLGVKKINSFSKEMQDVFKEFTVYETTLIQKIESDLFYEIKPVNKSVCMYCDLNVVCPKRSSEDYYVRT